MKIALSQLNYHIGNFSSNYAKMVKAINKAKNENCDLIVFSELAICGYSPLDLLYKEEFIQQSISTIHQLAKECNSISALVGGPSIPTNSKGKQLQNSVWLLQNGEAVPVAHKTLLPSYSMLNEYRYFQPNQTFNIIPFKGKRLALLVGEDLWDDQPASNKISDNQLNSISPLQKLAALKPDLVVHLSAQPFAHNKIESDREFICQRAKKYNLPIYSVNQVGANSELIFGGGSMYINSNGVIAQQLSFFEEDFSIIENEKKSSSSTIPEKLKLIHKALTTGIRDYFAKLGFKKALVGLSGGLDSALVAALAAQALGSENVHGILMPSAYSSDHSITDAVDLASNLGMSYETISIEEIYSVFKNSLNSTFAQKEEDVTEENIQARIRGTLLMAYSNKFGNILLNTSNKSESAVGYGTLYGDMNGGLAVIADLYKTEVFDLARYINREKEIIPNHTIIKPPSAELRPDQKDSDSLPDYNVLDNILYQLIEENKSANEIIAQNGDKENVERIAKMLILNEYKRFQAPPTLRITSQPFGAGRHLPLVSKHLI